MVSLFTSLQSAQNALEGIASGIAELARILGPNEFAFINRLSIILIQLQVPGRLTCPADLKFERPHLTPEEREEQ